MTSPWHEKTEKHALEHGVYLCKGMENSTVIEMLLNRLDFYQIQIKALKESSHINRIDDGEWSEATMIRFNKDPDMVKPSHVQYVDLMNKSPKSNEDIMDELLDAAKGIK